jgi:hypothetical protein
MVLCLYSCYFCQHHLAIDQTHLFSAIATPVTILIVSRRCTEFVHQFTYRFPSPFPLLFQLLLFCYFCDNALHAIQAAGPFLDFVSAVIHVLTFLCVPAVFQVLSKYQLEIAALYVLLELQCCLKTLY